MLEHKNTCPNCKGFEFKKLHANFTSKVIGHYDKATNKIVYCDDNKKFDYEDKCRKCGSQIGFIKVA